MSSSFNTIQEAREISKKIHRRNWATNTVEYCNLGTIPHFYQTSKDGNINFGLRSYSLPTNSDYMLKDSKEFNKVYPMLLLFVAKENIEFYNNIADQETSAKLFYAPEITEETKKTTPTTTLSAKSDQLFRKYNVTRTALPIPSTEQYLKNMLVSHLVGNSEFNGLTQKIEQYMRYYNEQLTLVAKAYLVELKNIAEQIKNNKLNGLDLLLSTTVSKSLSK